MEDDTKLQKLIELLEHLERPGASMRSAVSDLQKWEVPDAERMKQAWSDPSSAPTSYDIAEATGISDEYPNVKGAIATAVDLVDPIDLAGLGLASKAGRKVAKAAAKEIKETGPFIAGMAGMTAAPVALDEMNRRKKESEDMDAAMSLATQMDQMNESEEGQMTTEQKARALGMFDEEPEIERAPTSYKRFSKLPK